MEVTPVEARWISWEGGEFLGMKRKKKKEIPWLETADIKWSQLDGNLILIFKDTHTYRSQWNN